MSEIKTFRDLIVWQKAMLLSNQVYYITRSFPDDERFGLTSMTAKIKQGIKVHN
jgi:hypothetical protein